MLNTRNRVSPGTLALHPPASVWSTEDLIFVIAMQKKMNYLHSTNQKKNKINAHQVFCGKRTVILLHWVNSLEW